jgi:retron-type reverse transcriptase
MTTSKTRSKPFVIEKRLVYEAYKAVKSNKGATGVDGQTLEQFEANLEGKPLQDLESDEFRELFSTAGPCCLHSEEEWR